MSNIPGALILRAGGEVGAQIGGELTDKVGMKPVGEVVGRVVVATSINAVFTKEPVSSTKRKIIRGVTVSLLEVGGAYLGKKIGTLIEKRTCSSSKCTNSWSRIGSHMGGSLGIYVGNSMTTNQST